MCEQFDLLPESIVMERLDCINDPRMKLATPLLQQPPVGDVLRERVLEAVFAIWKQTRLIDELGGLQAVERAAKRFVRQLGHCPEQGERHVPADNRGDLQEALVVQGEPVDASRQHYLDRGRDLDGVDRSGQPIVARRTLQCLGLHQRPDRLFQEERVSALDEELLERCQRGGVAEKRIQEFTGAFGRKRSQWYLVVVRLAGPAVLVLGPIGCQQ